MDMSPQAQTNVTFTKAQKITKKQGKQSAMQIIHSMGTLNDATGKQIIANVEYEIYYVSPTKETLGEWYGNFVLGINNIVSLDKPNEYIIVLNDKRKGKVILTRMEVQPDTTIYYEFQGSGPLK